MMKDLEFTISDKFAFLIHSDDNKLYLYILLINIVCLFIKIRFWENQEENSVRLEATNELLNRHQNTRQNLN